MFSFLSRLTAGTPSIDVVELDSLLASGAVPARVAAYYRTPLGDRSPHAGGHWIKTLSCLNDCLVWSAITDDYDEAEREMLDDFSSTVPAAKRRALHDPLLVLPFANLKNGRGQVKVHGIRGSKRA